jgi:hypothetical protein
MSIQSAPATFLKRSDKDAQDVSELKGRELEEARAALGGPPSAKTSAAVENNATAFIAYVASNGEVIWVDVRADSGSRLSIGCISSLPLLPGGAQGRSHARYAIIASAINSAIATNQRHLARQF